MIYKFTHTILQCFDAIILQYVLMQLRLDNTIITFCLECGDKFFNQNY